VNRAFLLLLLAACAAPPPPPPVRAEVHLPIDRFARVAEGVYRSAQPSDTNLRALKEAGFHTILNLRSSHSERAKAEALGLRVVEIPMKADADPPSDDDVRRFFEVVLDRTAQPVLIHCAVGKDRTGAMAALYRIEVDGWTNSEAITEMLGFGFNQKYTGLLEFVRAYRPRGFTGK
jgi:protein tyrosine/serine phosphatase